MKVFYKFTAIYWFIQFILGIITVWNKETIPPIVSLCALFLCSLYSLSESENH